MQEDSDMPVGFPASFQEIRQMNLLYSCAVREVCTKLENLNQEFQMTHAHNPIQHITSRIKRPESIRKKMLKRGLPLDYETMREKITDIGGVRVICSYISDIYTIVDILKRQNDVLVLNTKDYIMCPKPNGYRSFHLIVSIPVYFSKETLMIPVEIQMRTIAMDFWASLEHQLRYKNATNIPDTLRERLTAISGDIFCADREMQSIYQEITQLE